MFINYFDNIDDCSTFSIYKIHWENLTLITLIKTETKSSLIDNHQA